MKTNYHTHTTRCMHAVGSDEEYVLSAIKGGFQILGFSDHTPKNCRAISKACNICERSIKSKSG